MPDHKLATVTGETTTGDMHHRKRAKPGSGKRAHTPVPHLTMRRK